MHEHYNRTNYPIFVCNHGNWDTYANGAGRCAAIPTEAAEKIGCKASHFGDARYVLVTLGVDVKRAIDLAANAT